MNEEKKIIRKESDLVETLSFLKNVVSEEIKIDVRKCCQICDIYYVG